LLLSCTFVIVIIEAHCLTLEAKRSAIINEEERERVSLFLPLLIYVTILVVGAICFISTTKRMILLHSLSPLHTFARSLENAVNHNIKTSQDENIIRRKHHKTITSQHENIIRRKHHKTNVQKHITRKTRTKGEDER